MEHAEGWASGPDVPGRSPDPTMAEGDPSSSSNLTVAARRAASIRVSRAMAAEARTSRPDDDIVSVSADVRARGCASGFGGVGPCHQRRTNLVEPRRDRRFEESTEAQCRDRVRIDVA